MKILLIAFGITFGFSILFLRLWILERKEKLLEMAAHAESLAGWNRALNNWGDTFKYHLGRDSKIFEAVNNLPQCNELDWVEREAVLRILRETV